SQDRIAVSELCSCYIIGALCCSFFVFFFSSRRRHTRWPRDWSSDVCSSDLEVAAVDYMLNISGDLVSPTIVEHEALELLEHRSIDRKSVVVGKECRSRWSAYH